VSIGRRPPWPRKLAEDSVLIARVTRISGNEQWLRLHRVDDQVRWEIADPRKNGWTYRAIGDAYANVRDALKDSLVTVGKSGVVEIDADPQLEQTVLRGILPMRIVDEDGEGWPEDIVTEWSGVGDDLPFDIPYREVWATVNGARVVLIEPDGSNDVHPVLFDRSEGEFVGLPVIAETSWFSESGGAPISWDGGASLSRLCPGILLSKAWGDVRQDTELLEASGPLEIGQAVASFIAADDQQFAAACLLEEFDPAGTLSEQDALHWAELVDSVNVSVTIDLEPNEEMPACRDALRQDPAYAAVAAALAKPDSARGLNLRGRLEDVRDSGVLGDIMGYNLGGL
jgi:hypothetical protein